MPEIPLTQGQVAIVDDVDYEFLMQFKWCAHRSYNRPQEKCRPIRNVKVDGKRTTRRMYHDIADRMGLEYTIIDHIDQNPLNNCRSNLRVATNSQNLCNRGLQRNNTSGVRGVSFYKATGKYRGRVKIMGKEIHLGSFDTAVEASKVVEAARIEHMGEFADA
jgi:hypothetical protein